MMRIKFTLAMLFAMTGSKYALSKQTPKKQIRPNPQRRFTIPSTGNFLIAAAYNFN
jgi:hypothetical protein